MSNQPFTFPPPPPPPARRNPTQETGGPTNQHSSQRGGGSNWNNQSPRGGPFRNVNGDYGQLQRGRSRAHGGNLGPHQNHVNARGGGQQFGSGRGRGDYGGRRPPPQDFSTAPKRSHEAAFAPVNRSSRPQAPPAVPSFNDSIIGLPEPRSGGVLSTKRSSGAPVRKTNALGLTPALHDDGAVSDDGDEESKLSSGLEKPGYEFEYRGQMSALKSPAEIAAWIAERKKRFPTMAKAEAAKREAEEKRKNEREAKQRQREEREREQARKRERRQTDEKSPPGRANSRHDGGPPANTIAEAETKAEKMRKRALKAEKLLAKAEAALQKAQKQKEASDPASARNADVDLSALSSRKSMATQNQPSDQRRMDNETPSTLDPPVPAVDTDDLGGSDIDSVSDSSDLSDSEATSSSGSDSSASDSSDHSGPEETTAKRQAPDRIPPPQRKQLGVERPELCRSFMKFRKCKFGDRCRYSHDRNLVQKNGRGARNATGKPGRKGLFQVMVEREEEQEREQMLRAIIALGNHGMLDENPPK